MGVLSQFDFLLKNIEDAANFFFFFFHMQMSFVAE